VLCGHIWISLTNSKQNTGFHMLLQQAWYMLYYCVEDAVTAYENQSTLATDTLHIYIEPT